MTRRAALALPRPALRLCAALLAAVAVSAQAQEAPFPRQPVKVLVGFAAGTGSDVVMRLVGQRMSELLGQPIVVDNRPGAAGTIATEAGARAPADGYTLTLGTTSTLITAPALSTNVRYDVERDFVPVVPLARTAFVLVVGTEAQAPKSLTELVAALRARPQSFASAGTGTITHLASEMFMKRAGLGAQHVPYKGSAQALGDVAGGQLLFASDTIAAALPLIRAGKVRPLGVTSNARVAALPDVPTFAESGVPGLAGFTLYAWWGLMAPARTPANVVAVLNGAVAKALDSDDVKAKLRGLELEPFWLAPPAFGTFLRDETPVWNKFIRDSGFKAEF